jgi:hypothetical protein
MRHFDNNHQLCSKMNKPLCSLVEQSLETAKAIIDSREAGPRIKLIAQIDELAYMKESYMNFVHFLQVRNVNNKFGVGPGVPCVRLAELSTAEKTLQNNLVVCAQRLLYLLRDSHNLPVADIMDELDLYSRDGKKKNLPRNQRNKIGVNLYKRSKVSSF